MPHIRCLTEFLIRFCMFKICFMNVFHLYLKLLLPHLAFHTTHRSFHRKKERSNNKWMKCTTEEFPKKTPHTTNEIDSLRFSWKIFLKRKLTLSVDFLKMYHFKTISELTITNAVRPP